MAVLKFRAWHIKAKKYFECVGFIDDTCFIKTQTKRSYGQILGDHLGDYLIEQSTGLYDSFGCEIFEGDLLITYKYSEYPRQVFWHEKKCQWVLSCEGFPKTGIALGESDLFKVVGNIHQNPELIPHHDPRTTN